MLQFARPAESQTPAPAEPDETPAPAPAPAPVIAPAPGHAPGGAPIQPAPGSNVAVQVVSQPDQQGEQNLWMIREKIKQN